MDTRNDTQRATRHAPTPRRKRSGATPEAKVTKAIRAYLDACGAHTLRTGAGVAAIDGRTIQIGQAGQSDLHVCLLGRFIALEIKSASGRATVAQTRYLERVRAAGGVGIVAHSLDELRTGLAAAFGAAQLAAWDAMQKRGRR